MSFRRNGNNFVFHAVKHVRFRAKVYLWRILLHYSIQKNSAAEAHRILIETNGDHAVGYNIQICFRCFKNNYFDIE